jgi:hypothetical protein
LNKTMTFLDFPWFSGVLRQSHMFQVSFYFIPFHSYLMLMGLIDSV